MNDRSKQQKREQFLWESTSELLEILPRDTEVSAYRISVLHWFNLELLQAVAGKGRLEQLGGGERPGHERSAETLLEELLELPFVEEYPRGAYGFHQMTREVLLKHLWELEPEFCRTVSDAAFEYFNQQIEGQDVPDSDDVFEWAYHLFNRDEDTAIEVISELIDSLYLEGLTSRSRALIRATQEQAVSGRFSPQVETMADYWSLRDAVFSVDLEKAEQLAGQLLSKPDHLVDPEVKAQAVTSLAQAYQQNGNYREALEQYLDALRRYRQLELPKGMSIALLGMGSASYRQSKYDEAKQRYFEALDLLLRNSTQPESTGGMPDLDSYLVHDPGSWLRMTEDQEGTNAVTEQEVDGDKRGKEDTTEANDSDTAPAVYYLILEKGLDDAGDRSDEEEREVLALVLSGVNPDIADIWLQLGYCFKEMDRYDDSAAAARLAWQMFADLDDTYNIQQALQLLLGLGAIVGENPFVEASEDVQKGLLQLARDQNDRKAELSALLGLAAVYIDRSDNTAAKDCYRKAIGIASELEDSLSRAATFDGLARIEAADYEWEAALVHLENAKEIYCGLKHREGEAQVLLTAGQVDLARHRPRLARENFKQANDLYAGLRVWSGQFESLVGLANVSSYIMDHKGAIGYLEQAVSMAVKHAVPSLEAEGKEALGKAYLAAQNPDAARATYQEVLDYYRRTGQRAAEAGLLIGKGDLELEERSFEQAEACYLSARETYAAVNNLDGELQSLYAMIGLELARDNNDQANSLSKEALLLAQKSNSRANEINALLTMANCFRMQEDYPEAFTAIKEALALDEDNIEALQLQADLLADGGEFGSSAAVLERALVVAPNNNHIWNALGWARENLGVQHARRAQDAYQKALSIQPEDPWAHKGLGNALRLAKDHGQAEVEYQRAFKLFQGYLQNTDVLAQEGWCLYQLGRYEEALDVLKRGIGESDQYFEMFDIGLVQLCMGNFLEGVKTYRESLTMIGKLSWHHQVGLLKVAVDDLQEAIIEQRVQEGDATVSEIVVEVEEKLGLALNNRAAADGGAGQVVS